MGVADRAVFGTRYPPPVSASIVINNYNYGQFVARAIDSALAQTHPCQVVVVDDGSTDGSRERIARYGDAIVALFQPNGGQAAAMNTGFAAATGEIVVFLDADDTLAPQAIASLLAAWRPESALVQYPLRIVDAGGHAVGLHPDPPSSLADGDVRQELLETAGFGVTVTSGLAFRRAALAAVMPIPREPYRIAADGYLVRAIAFTGPVQRLGEPLGTYSRHHFNGTRVGEPADVAAGMRRRLEWARREFDTTRALAARYGHTMRAGAGEDGADYVGYLLGLRLTDPSDPLVRHLGRWSTLRRYLAMRWASPWSLRRRVTAISLATAAACAPRSVGPVLVHWLQDADARPAWARRLGRTLRGGRGADWDAAPAPCDTAEEWSLPDRGTMARRIPPRAPRAS